MVPTASPVSVAIVEVEENGTIVHPPFASSHRDNVGCFDEKKPRHPMTAYIFFFRMERERMLLGIDHIPLTIHYVENSLLFGDEGCKNNITQVGLPFADLVHHIGSKWKALDPDLKQLFHDKATEEHRRYVRELQAWNDLQK